MAGTMLELFREISEKLVENYYGKFLLNLVGPKPEKGVETPEGTYYLWNRNSFRLPTNHDYILTAHAILNNHYPIKAIVAYPVVRNGTLYVFNWVLMG